MLSFFSFLGRHRGGAWAWALLLLSLGWLRPEVAQASHVRAGDIQAQVDSATGNPNRINFKLTVYRDNSAGSVELADDQITIFFGDGSMIVGVDAPTNPTGMVRSSDVFTPDRLTEIKTYTFSHVYAGSNSYVVSYVEDNRSRDVVNMTRSDGQSFYISTTITISQALGRNRSAVLRAPAIDRGAVGQVFLHNPAGYDADGDSLAYKLRTCQQVPGGKKAVVGNTPQPTVCDGYVYPADASIMPKGVQVVYPLPGVPVTPGVVVGVPRADAIIVQDPITGQITWNAPSKVGTYNLAFTVEEWRRTPGGRLLIGAVIRDMQIIVSATANLAPSLIVPTDVCVVANKPVTLNVSATDGSGTGAEAPSAVTLIAYSGILPPATFVQNTTGPSVTGTFRWTPDCSKVSSLPYVVVFKAQDSPPASTGSPILIDEKPVRITVLGPPPQNVKAVATGTTKLISILTWDSYACTNATELLIFRKEGCSTYTPGTCDTGLPASEGYTRIASVPVATTTYSDDGGAAGLSRGKTYSYRIYATFALPARSSSVVSEQSCITFDGRAAKLTNVDVTDTQTATGKILVKWTQPRNANGVPFPAPYGYRLGRAVGAGTVFTPVATITSLTDTTYVDQGLNTVDNQYKYQLVFFNTANGVEQSEAAASATSVRTSLVPNGLARTITVNWAQQVPWDNTKQPTLIFRRGPAASTFIQIASVASGLTGGTYLDQDPTLVRDQTYCYYVQTNGQYADVNSQSGLLYANLLNKSQQLCVALRAVPCTPVLSLVPIDCDALSKLPSFPEPNQQYQNSLSWTVGSTPAGCDVAAAYYRILRSSGSGTYVAIDSTSQLAYVNRLLQQPNYCYVVQAVSAAGIRSALSNSVCQESCVFFSLPNIFTPNGDGTNDVFKPKTAAGVLKTHTQIFNRWGRKVYEGDDPYINWTGGGATGESGTSDMVSGGLYYYLVDVQFSDTAQTRRTFKGWVQVMR